MLTLANTLRTGFLGKSVDAHNKTSSSEGRTNAADLLDQIATGMTKGTVTSHEGRVSQSHSKRSTPTHSISEGGYRPGSYTASQAGETSPEDLEGWRSSASNSRSASNSERSLRKMDIKDVDEYLSDSDYSDSEDHPSRCSRTVVERKSSKNRSTRTSIRSVPTPGATAGYGALFQKRVSLAEVDDECLTDDEEVAGAPIVRIQPIRINYTANVTVKNAKNRKIVTKAVMETVKSFLNVEKNVAEGTLNGVKLTQMCPTLKHSPKTAKVSMFKRCFSNWFQVLPPQVKVDVALNAGDGTFHKENFTSELHLDQYLGLVPRTKSKKKAEAEICVATKELEALADMNKVELMNVVTTLKFQDCEMKNSGSIRVNQAEQNALEQMSREELLTVVATLKARVQFLKKFQSQLSFESNKQ